MLTKSLPLRPKTKNVAPRLLYWPGGKNTYGKNPNGEALYRVVWSETRSWRIGGCWPDGAIEYRWVPYYGGVKAWMLEKWLTPEEFGGSKVQWEESTDQFLSDHGVVIYTMGPWPAKGWYEHVYTFPADGEPNIEALAPLFDATKELGIARIKQGIALYHERMRKDWENKVEAGIDDAQAAFHNAPSSVNPGKVTADKVSLSRPEEFKRELRKKKGLHPEEQKPTPEELNLPNSGFSIR